MLQRGKTVQTYNLRKCKLRTSIAYLTQANQKQRHVVSQRNLVLMLLSRHSNQSRPYSSSEGGCCAAGQALSFRVPIVATCRTPYRKVASLASEAGRRRSHFRSTGAQVDTANQKELGTTFPSHPRIGRSDTSQRKCFIELPRRPFPFTCPLFSL